MSIAIPDQSIQLRSTVQTGGQLEIALDMVETPTPGPGEILVRMQAAPINPSDLGLLFAMADVTKAESTGDAARPSVVAPIAEGTMRALSARLDQSLAVGNEGAGIVVAAGDAASEALIGRTVSIVGGATY